jgi:hypothetical protein
VRGGVTVRAKRTDGLGCKSAVRTAAVRDYLPFPWQLSQPLLKLIKGNRDRTREVSRPIFLYWSHIDDHQRLARLEAGEKLVAAHRHEIILRSEI